MVARRVPQVIQELSTIPELLRFPRLLLMLNVRVAQYLIFCILFFRTLFVPFSHCFTCLSIYSIFTLFLQVGKAQHCVYKGSYIIIKRTNGHHVHHITNLTKISFHFSPTGDVIAVIIW